MYKIARFIYDWPNPWDGLAPGPYNLTLSQNNLGNKITVFCGCWAKSGGPEQIKGVKVIAFPREPILGLMLLTTAPLVFIYFLIWKIFNKVDIYHAHGHFGLYLYLYKYLFGKLDKTPLVSHFHNTTAGRIEASKLEKSENKDSFFIKHVSLPLSLLSDKLATKVSSACIFVSKKNIEEAVKFYGVNRQKCFLVESGVSSDTFLKKETRAENLDKKTILYVGALTERKNVTSLVESLCYLPKHYHLRLIGRGFPSYIDRIKDIALKNNFEERLELLGYIENNLLPKYYKEADIFVIPSLYEGLPKVVLESLASGVPVLASGFDIKSPIRGLQFLTDPLPKNIAKNIEQIIKSKISVDVAYIDKFYSWKAKAGEVQLIYDKIV